MKDEESKFFLRFAITPNCNFRCEYCNPEGKIEKANVLSEDEIMQIMAAGIDAGVNRVHWTGGEPTLLNMEKLISKSRDLGYVEQVLTTNGSRGGDYVRMMADEGLDRLIVSLDTLDPVRFKKITKSDSLDKVLDTIETATSILHQPTKVNVVYLKETVEEMPELIKYAVQINSNPDDNGAMIMKFLEMTEMNPAFFNTEGKLFKKHHTGKDIMMNELSRYGTLEEATKDVIGNNPNTYYYSIPEVGLKIGMINIPSEGYKCGGKGCAKLRLNPYGKIAVCVNQEPVEIKGKSQQHQTKVIQQLQEYRSMLDTFYPKRTHRQNESNFGYWRFGETKNNGKS